MSTDERKGAAFFRKLEGYCNLDSLTSHFYPTTIILVTFIWSQGTPYSKFWPCSGLPGMSHNLCTMTDDLLVSVFAFIEWPPKFRKCMNARPAWCHDYKTVLGPTYSIPDCRLPIHIGATSANYYNMIVDVDEIGWERAVTVPIARPPPRTTQVHRPQKPWRSLGLF